MKKPRQVMLIAAGQANLAIDENFIVRFPCKDLKTIDKLWIKHSNGHFGFSVQKRIWESLGGPDQLRENYLLKPLLTY